MKEEFLHYAWEFNLFSMHNLQSSLSEGIEIVKNGIKNLNSGPDFLNAQIKIDNQFWVGNVEIHLKSSDWYAHNHETDVNYDAVILHVVWEHDSEVYMKNNKPLPTLVLKNLVDKNLLNNYQNLFSKQQRWIFCQNNIATIDSFTFSNWRERLYFERLEYKSNFIVNLLENSKGDFEAVLFLLIAKNFGLKVNGDAFFQLAKSIDFSIIRKIQFNQQKFLALLFGQAGFLEDNIQDEYFISLKKEYDYLKHKYKLESIPNKQFSFFRMRPNNFPTIRIAQLVSLFSNTQNLFSKIIYLESIEDIYKLFFIEVNDFWKMHYTFTTASKKTSKKLTKPFIDLLIINTIIPLKFVYQKSRGEVEQQGILKLIQQLKPEKNSIVSKFSELKINAKNAFDSQSLIELKNNYCANKRCLECAIGNKLLRN